MTTPLPSPFIVHDDAVKQAHIDQGRYESLRLQVVELKQEQPLWAERMTRPEGASKGPVVLIHGFAQNRFSWHTTHRSMAAWLAHEGWDVFNLELRGHGRSRRRSKTVATSFMDYPLDLSDFSNALYETPFWVGHSLGASVAYMADADKRATSRGIVSLGGLYRFGQAGWLLPTLTRWTRRLPMGVHIGDIQVHTGVTGRAFARLFPLLDLAAFGAPIAGWWPGSIEPELAKERMRRGFDYIPIRVWQEMSEWSSADRVPWDDGWRTSTTPCFIVLGDRDTMLYPDEGMAAFERSGAEDKTVLVLDDTHGLTHWGHLDIVLGKHAQQHVWTAVDTWMTDRL